MKDDGSYDAGTSLREVSESQARVVQKRKRGVGGGGG